MESQRPNRLGKYQLLARIAKGGMAEIYLARQRGMVGFTRLVVIKRILPHLAEEPEFVRMFMEEARVAALVNHPGVVQLHDVGQWEGNYYIAMEYINGLSLGIIARRARQNDRPLPFDVAAEVVAQACDGLHAAHELRDESGRQLNLVHRDVSPHNLMVSCEGQVKLVDFGIAKAKDSSVKTRTGKIKGKYPYLSPEQCRGDPLDRRTDIFSLGTVLHELLTARRLFHRTTELMILKAITEEPIIDSREINPDIPEALARVLGHAMERHRDDRFATAAEMGRALRQVVRDLDAAQGPEHLASYLRTEHADLLEARNEALEQVLALRPSDSSTVDVPPSVEGFDEASGSRSALDEASGSRSAPTSSTAGLGPERRRPTFQLPAATRTGAKWSRARVVVIGALAAILLAAGGGLLYRRLHSARPDGPALRFGLPPSYPSRVAQREMRPFLRYLERQLDRPVDLVVPSTYHELRRMLLQGKLDFANLPALQLVLARHEDPRLEVVATQTYEKARRYVSYLVVQSDSAISRVEQLEGKRMCYVDPESTSGYLLPRLFLREKGLDPDTALAAARFSGNHLKVLRELLDGTCDVGAVYSGVVANAQALGIASSRIRVLAVTGQIPYDVICTGSTMGPPLVRRLKQALMRMNPRRDLGQKLVGETFRIDGFVEPRLDEFSAVEQAARLAGMIK